MVAIAVICFEIESHCGSQAGLEHGAILLPQSPYFWHYKREPSIIVRSCANIVCVLKGQHSGFFALPVNVFQGVITFLTVILWSQRWHSPIPTQRGQESMSLGMLRREGPRLCIRSIRNREQGWLNAWYNRTICQGPTNFVSSNPHPIPMLSGVCFSGVLCLGKETQNEGRRLNN